MQSTLQPHLDEALSGWKSVLGAEHVCHDEQTLQKYSRSTIPYSTRPLAVLFPGSTKEVQEVMRIANRHSIPIHPISTGNNWGYSDSCAPTDGQVILHLRRMSGILEVNSELAYAVVEPGVTQGQLSEHLRKWGIPLMVDVTGAGPDTSLIGNTVERGIGHSPYGDRWGNACALEIVLSDGRLLRTGFAHYEGAKLAHLHKHGIGPSLEGLFSQSNFGVVVRMTVWLAPKPEKFSIYALFLKDKETIGIAIDCLRPLRLSGSVKSVLHIGNDLRNLSLIQSYPWEEMNGKTPLSDEVRKSLSDMYGIAAWVGAGGLYGSTEEVEAAKSTLRKALTAVPGITFFFVDDEEVEGTLDGTRSPPESVPPNFVPVMFMMHSLLTGTPPPASVQGGLWRVRKSEETTEMTSDPLDVHSGLIWVAPALPQTGKDALRVNAIAEETLNSYGYDYLCTLSLATQRTLCAVITIAYDRLDLADCERARECYLKLLMRLMQEGYLPYRLGNLVVPGLMDEKDTHNEVVQAIKKVIDPKGIISPGHYLPSQLNLKGRL